MKRYCDYDAIVHYQPGEFASKFADNLNEKLKPANLDPKTNSKFKGD